MLEDKSKASKGQYEKFSMEHKQMLRVGAIDCHDHGPLCKKLDVDQSILPTFRVYPPMPIPTEDYKPEGDIDTDKLKKMAYRYIGNNTVEIT